MSIKLILCFLLNLSLDPDMNFVFLAASNKKPPPSFFPDSPPNCFPTYSANTPIFSLSSFYGRSSQTSE